MAKQDDYTRYTIRLPTPLYERVKEAAGEKSVNAEIVATLEEQYPEPIAKADEITREYRELLIIALDPSTPVTASGELTARVNELDRQYFKLTGKRL